MIKTQESEPGQSSPKTDLEMASGEVSELATSINSQRQRSIQFQTLDLNQIEFLDPAEGTPAAEALAGKPCITWHIPFSPFPPIHTIHTIHACVSTYYLLYYTHLCFHLLHLLHLQQHYIKRPLSLTANAAIKVSKIQKGLHKLRSIKRPKMKNFNIVKQLNRKTKRKQKKNLFSKNFKGKVIDGLHELYTLSAGMILGIRYSMRRSALPGVSSPTPL